MILTACAAMYGLDGPFSLSFSSSCVYPGAFLTILLVCFDWLLQVAYIPSFCHHYSAGSNTSILLRSLSFILSSAIKLLTTPEYPCSPISDVVLGGPNSSRSGFA
jgi:hypothetical protein